MGIENLDFKMLCIKFLMVLVIGVLLNYFSVIIQSKFSLEFIGKLRKIVVEKLLKCEYGYFEKEHSGNIQNKYTFDMNTVSSYMSSNFAEFITDFITFICCFLYLLTVNLAMTLVIAICIPLTIALAAVISSPTYQLMDNFEQKMGEVASIATDSVNGAMIEKAYHISPQRVKVFNKVMDEATQFYIKYERLVIKSGPYKYLIKSAPTFICIILGFYNSYRGIITNGELIAFILLLNRISDPLSKLTLHMTDLKTAMVSMDKLLEIMYLKDEKFGEKTANRQEFTVDMSKSETVFELEDVSFTYHSEQAPILSQLNLSVKPGKTYAIVGASGCGKSTLFKLLLGFHKPTSGILNFVGDDLNQLDIDSVREQISYVGQTTFLFNKTIAENIGLAKEGATLEQIVEAAKKAYAHDFIMQLPQGYQTVLTEGGQNLSGGQRQRISIAMAFLKDAPIFIMDEMTSALDIESEKLIQKALEDYKKHKTIIIIAHRLSTIIDADHIYVLKDGAVAEQGTHLQLLKQDGIYRMLYHNQPSERSCYE